ncbi:hypothetical protein [Corynebacterium uterequi]|uniref:Uncharacterized protein n=1 Tax=Corynebacterium uterequi TaxID=1072256 RepID=A0A0G3HGN5_9CORY|nr:hypothetical protein [Corynebacterium uterequi]AKK11098.1 hypothetical protein CUTER_05505 [Corynebacterium uterequi]
MTIRSDFQPTVDEFIDDLHEFATGSYLVEGETEFWEQPFDPVALPELKRLLERLLDGLDALPADAPADILVTLVSQEVTALEEFNERHDGAVIEPEEWATIRELIANAAAETGATEDALAELDNLEF